MIQSYVDWQKPMFIDSDVNYALKYPLKNGNHLATVDEKKMMSIKKWHYTSAFYTKCFQFNWRVIVKVTSFSIRERYNLS